MTRVEFHTLARLKGFSFAFEAWLDAEFPSPYPPPAGRWALNARGLPFESVEEALQELLYDHRVRVSACYGEWKLTVRGSRYTEVVWFTRSTILPAGLADLIDAQ